METIVITASNGVDIIAEVVYKTDYYIVHLGFNCDNKYCVALNSDSRYPAVARLNNKRQAIRLANYLTKNLDNEGILAKNPIAVNAARDFIINWLLLHKIYNSCVGNTKLYLNNRYQTLLLD